MGSKQVLHFVLENKIMDDRGMERIQLLVIFS